MLEENPQSTAPEALNPKGKKVKTAHTILVALAILSAASTGIAYWSQQQRIDNVASKLNDANQKTAAAKAALLNEIKSNSAASTALQKKYQDTLTKLSDTTIKTSSAQADLGLTVGKSLTTNFDNSGTTFSALAINITLKNDTASAITVVPSAYVIKDTTDHVFGATFISQTGFGKDFVPLETSAIQPGQSVTGYIGVQVNDANVTDYIIGIGIHTYKVSATKLASFPVTE